MLKYLFVLILCCTSAISFAAIKELNDDNFDSEISNGIVIVDFSATWCGPCKKMEPILENFAKERKDITIVKLDVDKNLKTANKHGIKAMPTLIIFKDGKLIKRHKGLVTESSLKKIVNDAINEIK